MTTSVTCITRFRRLTMRRRQREQIEADRELFNAEQGLTKQQTLEDVHQQRWYADADAARAKSSIHAAERQFLITSACPYCFDWHIDPNSSKHVPKSQDYSGNTIPRLIDVSMEACHVRFWRWPHRRLRRGPLWRFLAAGAWPWAAWRDCDRGKEIGKRNSWPSFL
jgi:hypothetical protein